MGGHGGLNILPQKRWNVYNYENREKVRRDEEAAAKEEQLKREQVRKQDAEFRLEQLRAARGLAPLNQAAEPVEQPAVAEPKSNHINLFEGIKIFDPIKGLGDEGGDKEDGFKRKKMKKEEGGGSSKVIMPEDEKYRLGYGVAGKGVKLPWYLERRSKNDEDDESGYGDGMMRVRTEEEKKGRKKTLEELREERLKREKREKERERALIMEKSRRDGTFSKNKGFSRRVPWTLPTTAWARHYHVVHRSASVTLRLFPSDSKWTVCRASNEVELRQRSEAPPGIFDHSGA